MATLYPFRALRPKPADAAQHRGGSVRRGQHRRSARAGRRQPAQFSARLARGNRAAGRAPIRTRPPSTSGRRRNFETLKETALVARGRAERLLLPADDGPPRADRPRGLLLDRRVRPRHHQEARADAARQGRRPHAAHARARRADRPGVPHLSRRGRGRSRSPRASTAGAPLFDFTRADGVRHTIWRVGGADRDALVAAFARDSGALHRRRPSPRGERRARARRDARRGLPARRSATAPTHRRCWRWRSRTTRCRSCRTTGSSRISAG